MIRKKRDKSFKPPEFKPKNIYLIDTANTNSSNIIYSRPRYIISTITYYIDYYYRLLYRLSGL